MKCKNVKKKLILFLEDDLSEDQKNDIQTHIDECSICLEQFSKLEYLLKNAEKIKRIPPAKYSWEKLYLRISEKQKRTNFFTEIHEHLSQYVLIPAVVVILVFGIFAGMQLGNFPASQKIEIANSEISAQDTYLKTIYIDIFNDIPPESIGGAYLKIGSNNN